MIQHSLTNRFKSASDRSWSPNVKKHPQDLQIQILADLFPIPPLVTLVAPLPALLNDLVSRVDVETALRPEPLEKSKEPRSGFERETTRSDDCWPGQAAERAQRASDKEQWNEVEPAQRASRKRRRVRSNGWRSEETRREAKGRKRGGGTKISAWCPKQSGGVTHSMAMPRMLVDMEQCVKTSVAAVASRGSSRGTWKTRRRSKT